MPRNKIARNSSARNNRAFGLNWALREARRQRSRTILAMLLIGFPLMIATFIAIAVPSSVATPEENLDARLGSQAECEVEYPVSGPFAEEEVAAAQERTQEILGGNSQSHSYLSLRGLKMGNLPEPTYSLLLLDSDDEILAEWLQLRTGEYATQSGEAVVGADLARALQMGVGDQFTVTLAGEQHTLRISGIAKYKPNHWETNSAAVISSASIPPELATVLANEEMLLTQLVVMDRPSQLEDVIALETESGQPTCRAVYLSHTHSDGLLDSNGLAITGALIAVLVLEIILLVGPAFLIGARQTTRHLALVAANGGSPRTLRRLTLLRNAILGLISSLVGVGVGLLLTVGIYWFAEVTERRAFMVLRVNWITLAALVVIGVLVSVAASWLPAREASQLQVVQALRGQRAQARVRRSSWMLGLVLVAAGFVLGLYGTRNSSSSLMMFGVMGVLLGLVASSGMIVQLLGGLARYTGFAMRFALRDAARNRTRTAGAIAAILAATSVLVAWTAYDNSESTRRSQQFLLPAAAGYGVVNLGYFDGIHEATAQQQQDILLGARSQIEADLKRYFADVELVPIYASVPTDDLLSAEGSGHLYPVTSPGNSCLGEGEHNYAELAADTELISKDPRCARVFGEKFVVELLTAWNVAGGPLVDDGTLFSRLDSPAGSMGIAEVLKSGKSVTTDQYLLDDEGTIWIEHFTDENHLITKIPGDYATGVTGDYRGVVLHPSVLADLNLTQVLAGYLIINAGLLGEELTDVTDLLQQEWSASKLPVSFHMFSEYQSDSAVVLAYLTGALILLVLGASGIAASLALTDARADLSTLSAVGAQSQVRRRIAASYGFIIAGTGSLLGGLGGLAGAAVFVSAKKHEYPYPDNSWQFIVNWPHFTLVVLGLPLVVAVLMWLFGGRKLPTVGRLQ